MGKRQLAAGLIKHVAKGDRIATRSRSVNAYQDLAQAERLACAGGNQRGLFWASAWRANGAIGHINLLLTGPAASATGRHRGA